MNPVTILLDWLEARLEKRTLAKVALGLAILLVVTQVATAWYVGSMGLSMGSTAYSDDGRTVVIDGAQRAKFARQYSADHEEGWCLYGSANQSTIRIDEVVHARALSKQTGHVTFTCVPESTDRLAHAEDPRLLGAVHSHPGFNRSYLSRLDIMLWGRVSPIVAVMGVYTERDGVKFFTTESLTRPLRTVVVADGHRRVVTRRGRQPHRPGGNGTASAPGTETP
ncbi:MAG: hypothetical protein ABEJ31_01645 [Haloarculaceae archaeon]